MSKIYEIVVFTSSEQDYTDAILNHIEKGNKWIHHRLYRKQCRKYEENIYLKDLRVLGREMKDIIIVDNAPYAFVLQIDNGYPIIPFTNNKDDKELTKLADYLLTDIQNIDDIRVKNVEKFGLNYLKNLGIEQYIQYYQEEDHQSEKESKSELMELDDLQESLKLFLKSA